MGEYKSQARRLRDRLKMSGVQIPVSLSLEAIAAVHGRKSWDEVAPSDKQPEPQVEATVEVGSAAQAPSPAPKRLTLIFGDIGRGKSFLAQALAREHQSRGREAPLCFSADHWKPEGDLPSAMKSQIESIKDWTSRHSQKGVLVIDEFDSLKESSQVEFLAAILDAAIAQVEVILTFRNLRSGRAAGWWLTDRGAAYRVVDLNGSSEFTFMGGRLPESDSRYPYGRNPLW